MHRASPSLTDLLVHVCATEAHAVAYYPGYQMKKRHYASHVRPCCCVFKSSRCVFRWLCGRTATHMSCVLKPDDVLLVSAQSSMSSSRMNSGGDSADSTPLMESRSRSQLDLSTPQASLWGVWVARTQL